MVAVDGGKNGGGGGSRQARGAARGGGGGQAPQQSPQQQRGAAALVGCGGADGGEATGRRCHESARETDLAKGGARCETGSVGCGIACE